jgi:hypothetical protein
MLQLNILSWAFESTYNIAHIVGFILALVLCYFRSPSNLGKLEFYNWKMAVFLLLCACELYGFSQRTGDPTWFLSSVKDFLLGLLYLFVFLWVLFMQFHTMLDLLQESQRKGRFHCSYVVGYLGMVAAIATWIILSFTDTDEGFYAVCVLAVSQLIQFAIVLGSAIHQRGSISYALLSLLVYIAGIVSLTYSLVQVVVIAIIGLVILAFLKGAASGSTQRASSSSNKSNIFDSIPGPGGGELYGDRIDKDHFVSSGEHYKRTYDGFVEVWERED